MTTDGSRNASSVQTERTQDEVEQRGNDSGTKERVNATLGSVDSARLRELMDRTDLDRNDVIRKALATQVFIQRTLDEGQSILIKDKDGTLREVAFVQ